MSVNGGKRKHCGEDARVRQASMTVVCLSWDSRQSRRVACGRRHGLRGGGVVMFVIDAKQIDGTEPFPKAVAVSCFQCLLTYPALSRLVDLLTKLST